MRKALIHGFVLFHLAAVVGWSFTSPDSATRFGRTVRRRLEPYMLPTGLWQGWNMFAPHPPMSNVYLEADVTFADGSRATWHFPNVSEMDYFERYRKERYRKWSTERVWSSGNVEPLVAQAAARFAARQVARPGNPARRVELVRYRAQIPSPKSKSFPPYNQPPAAWDRYVFYTCELDDAGGITRVHAATQPGATQPSTRPPATGEGGR